MKSCFNANGKCFGGMIIGIIFALIICLCSVELNAAEDPDDVKRSLYIVYDNSGSMTEKSDAWCKAAYAVETLAAMMNDGDDLYLYLMDDRKDKGYYILYHFKQKGTDTSSVCAEIHKTLQDMKYTEHTHADGLLAAIAAANADTAGDVQVLIFSDGIFNYEKGSNNEDKVYDLDNLSNTRTIYYQMGNKLGDSIINATETFPKDSNDILATFTEIGNLIYDRQEVPYERSGINLSFELEAPVKKLIIMVQTQDRKLNDNNINMSTQELETSGSVSYHTIDASIAKVDNKMFDNEAIQSNYFATMKMYEELDSGVYTFQIPENAEVSVYAIYEMEYTVTLQKKGEDTVWDLRSLEGTEPIREGEYLIEIGLINARTGNIIQEAELYERLSAELEIRQEGQVPASLGVGQTVYLAEGTCAIEGEISLAGNYPRDVNFDFKVGHALGLLTLEVTPENIEIDIDELEADDSSFFVRIREDGEYISNIMDKSLELTESERFGYRVEEDAEGWKVIPYLLEGVEKSTKLLGTEQVQLIAHVDKDGQQGIESETVRIRYFAAPRDISFQLEVDSVQDAWELLWNSNFRVNVTIDDEEIDITDSIDNIEVWVDSEEDSIIPEMTLSQHGQTPLYLTLELQKNFKFWKFVQGGFINGTMHISMERYGQVCKGDAKFLIKVGELSALKMASITFRGFIVLYIIWLLVGKKLLGCSFWGILIGVSFTAQIGKKSLPGQLSPNRILHWHIGRPFSSTIVIPLQKIYYLGFSTEVPPKLLLKRKIGGKYVISNINKFIDSKYVLKTGRRVIITDRYVDMAEGIELELLGKNHVNIRIYEEEL